MSSSPEETGPANENEGIRTPPDDPTASGDNLDNRGSASKRKSEKRKFVDTDSAKQSGEGYDDAADVTRQDAQVKESSVPSDLSTGDKLAGNSALVTKHYNTLESKGLTQRSQSRIVHMRNFNNWIKSMLISEYLGKARQGKGHRAPFKVLDMCCGKGGDLLKWSKANITHLICADIAEVSVEQCQSRYNDLLNRSSNNRGFAPVFTAEFISADCTKVRLREKYKDASCQLDLVSCQFAFHYSFESLQQAECMLRNAGESLRLGGYFIGTIPDAYDLVSRWQNSDTNKFGNDIYSVEFLCEDKVKPPLFGAKYNFHLEEVVNCPEFLVHLPTLTKLALKYGLELVMFERFENFYERMKSEGRSLLGKMRALETYPPCHEAPLLGQNPEDYRYAAQYMQNSTGHRKIGTLSLPEWEATSLYAVFAFQKMKTTWNAEGKPEYFKV
ncbi:mRNA cap guanine-N7 methyltransferase [Diprion similis]|uniref:mRNA cap guanine-N7 methyltransferase n=1 Tax=Diprion similis TaxID=362088 RepID=UPI001EF9B307|nr:mRNA cap guanine-N7 methyltransferase [Diprion similis]